MTITITQDSVTTRVFESSPWSSREITPEVPVRRILAHVSREHVEEATWSLYRNPISIALTPHLAERACASMFWNSDSYSPRYPEDDARVGVHLEIYDPETGHFVEEHSYWLPLPRRATRAMWKLCCEGIYTFQPFNVALTLPTATLRTD